MSSCFTVQSFERCRIGVEQEQRQSKREPQTIIAGAGLQALITGQRNIFRQSKEFLHAYDLVSNQFTQTKRRSLPLIL